MISVFISLLAYILAFFAFLFKNFSKKEIKLIPNFFLMVGLLFYVLTLLERFVQTKTFPVGDVYGMISLVGNLSVLLFLTFSRKYEFSPFGAFVSFFAFLSTLLLIPSKGLGFSNPLYALHITSAGFSYAFLIFAGLTSTARLVIEKKLREKKVNFSFAPLKILKKLERVFIIAGFVGLTLTLVFGSFWSKVYLGTHWVNDPKLLVTLILWLYYGFLSHMFIFRSFKPSQISYLSILGMFLSLIALLFFRHSF